MYTIYTTNNCPNCKQLKNILSNNHVEYQELNIEEDFKAMAKLVENNLMQVPVLEKDGKLCSGNLATLIKNVEEVKEEVKNW